MKEVLEAMSRTMSIAPSSRVTKEEVIDWLGDQTASEVAEIVKNLELESRYYIVYRNSEDKIKTYQIGKIDLFSSFGNKDDERSNVGFKAYCYGRKAVRSFRHDRIISLTKKWVLNSPPSRRDLELTHVFGSAFGLGDFLCEEDFFYNSLCSDLCDALRLNILEIRKHSFDPHGFTLLALLKESHMSFHTWPEHECVFFDLKSL